MANIFPNERALIKALARLKRQGKKIVTFNGSFDLLHIGHIEALKEAKRQGDVLVVLLNSDASVRSYKGPHRPIVGERDRSRTIAALAVVDYVTIFDDINPKRILGVIKPHVHANGADWGKNCVEREVVEANGGRIHVTKSIASTSGLIKKILDVYQKPVTAAIFLDRDGTINHRNTQGYVHDAREFRFMPGALEALQKLTKSAYKIIIVTNQSGIGRGNFKKRETEALHDWLRATLAAQGVRIDGIYYCPHRPEDECVCRKPKIGMLLRAARDFGLSLNGSWMVGDDPRDVLTGREANVRTIKIAGAMPRGNKVKPHYVAKGLPEAVQIILGNDL